MGHSHPSLILLKAGEREHHPRWIQMLSGGSEVLGFFPRAVLPSFCLSCASQ